MKVLGISPLDKDSTVSIVVDGEVVFAAGEERFSRVKQQDGFPTLALNAALAYTGLRMADFDAVAYPFLAAKSESHLIEKNLSDEAAFNKAFVPVSLSAQLAAAKAKVPQRLSKIEGLHQPNETMQKGLLHDSFYHVAATQNWCSATAAERGSSLWAASAREGFERWDTELTQGLRHAGWQGDIKRVEHHQSHAANAFYCSGFDRALCITLDGYGTGLAGSVSIAEQGKITRVHGVQFPNSLGTLYEHVTSSIGFKPGRHEGKIVGLAAYGDPSILQDVLLSRIAQHDGNFQIYQANNVYFARYLAAKFPKVDVAAAYQRVLELVATNFVRYWVEKTGINAVVLSGGVTANVKLNQRIFEIDGVERIFVYPNMGDGGCATGAALVVAKPTQPRVINNAYWGPDYSREQMLQALQQHDLAYTEPAQLAMEVAQLIHSGKVVARFDGRMEYGPRALGNRSIMYHAREPK